MTRFTAFILFLIYLYKASIDACLVEWRISRGFHVIMSCDESSIGNRVVLQIDKLSKKRHQIYLLATVFIATLGYVYFLFFPIAFFVALYLLIDLIQGANSAQDWIWVGVTSSVAAICVNVSYYCFKISIPQVMGLKLSRKLAPGLFDVIKEVQLHYRRPTIHNIVLTEKYEIRLERTPRRRMPVLFTNTLAIGLPLLQTLSPDEFRCEVSRCIGQHSSIVPRMTLFIYNRRALWRVYSHSMRKNKKPGMRPIRWFFVLYSSVFDLVSVPAIRQEELNADSCALDFINEQVVLDTLKSESIGRAFLELHYWTSVRSMAIKNPKVKITPFAKLEKVLKTVSTSESRRKWLSYAYEADQLPGDTMPPLRERVEGIGHIKVRTIPEPETDAAEVYFGTNKNKVVSIIDKLWQSTTLTPWLKEYKEQRRSLEKIQRLSRKSRQRILWPVDIFRYALLARKVHGSPLGESIRKLVKRNMKHLLPAYVVSKFRPQAQASDIYR